VNTVTGNLPGFATSAAEMDALSPVVPIKTVVRLLPFHWTTEHGSILLVLSSFTVRRNPGTPAFALFGESELTDGMGSGVVGTVIVKMAEFVVATALVTVTVAVPWNAVCAGVSVAVSCVEFTNVVGRSGAPFQLTTASLVKFEPFTVSTVGPELQYGVEGNCVVDAESDEIIGPAI